jgi:hypothetical protein
MVDARPTRTPALHCTLQNILYHRFTCHFNLSVSIRRSVTTMTIPLPPQNAVEVGGSIPPMTAHVSHSFICYLPPD